MLVATAGHIDHGKTALVRALTGVETDRLPEEKARGISIDLGFAYWRPDGAATMIGFVDVPGHERFIRNMLAGVGGVGCALVVVAADDGVMPQTVEHVRILDLLGIERGLVAISKCDRVERARIDEVRREVAGLLAPTGLANSAIFETSAVTGAGIPDLVETLREAAAHDAEPARGRSFRMAIDRAFSVAGAGTVVTGTVLAGAAAIEDRLVVAPRGLQVRVRGLQSAGASIASVRAGQRCAVNLAGIELADVSRGDWLVAAAMHAPTLRIEARLRLLADRAEPLRHNARVHLHHGAADVGARVLVPRGRSLRPGEDGIVHLAPDRPVSAVAGERFVIRDPSGRALLGGGTVLDPLVGGDRRRRRDRLAIAQAIDPVSAAATLRNLLAIPGHEVDARWLSRSFNLTPEAARSAIAGADAIGVGRDHAILLPRSRVAALGEAVIATLAEHHRGRPEEAGLAVRYLRAALPEPVSPEAFAAMLRQLGDDHRIVPGGPLIRLPGHTPSFGAAETALWRAVLELSDDDAPQALVPVELARRLRTPEPAIRTMLQRRRIAGELWGLTDARFMRREHVAALAVTAAGLAERRPEGFTAAQFRDAAAIGRNLVIQVLEFFDRIGVTARRGDARTVRPGYEAIVGPAPKDRSR